MSKSNKPNNSDFVLFIPAVLMFFVLVTFFLDAASLLENFIHGVQTEKDWNKLGTYYLGGGLFSMFLLLLIGLLWADMDGKK